MINSYAHHGRSGLMTQLLAVCTTTSFKRHFYLGGRCCCMQLTFKRHCFFCMNNVRGSWPRPLPWRPIIILHLSFKSIPWHTYKIGWDKSNGCTFLYEEAVATS